MPGPSKRLTGLAPEKIRRQVQRPAKIGLNLITPTPEPKKISLFLTKKILAQWLDGIFGGLGLQPQKAEWFAPSGIFCAWKP